LFVGEERGIKILSTYGKILIIPTEHPTEKVNNIHKKYKNQLVTVYSQSVTILLKSSQK